MPQTPEDVVRTLQEIRDKQELTIIKLSKQFSEILSEPSERERMTDDISTEVLENPTPSTLEADLSHYKELFSKLRFSYLEQVTKEKFIRAIVGDPPLIVDQQENIELEEALAEKKIALKSLKTEVSQLITHLENKGRELYQKYQNIQLQTVQLREIPLKLFSLEESVQSLRGPPNSGSNPELHLPLDKTIEYIEQREKEDAELCQQITQLQEIMVPRKVKELERLEIELQYLEAKSLSSSQSAREAKKKKEEAFGGVENDLEETGRWWAGVETGLIRVFGTKS